MKKILLVLTMSGGSLYAQINVNWQLSLGGEANEISSAALKTADGGYLVTGTTSSEGGEIKNNHGEKDGWVVKLSAAGEVEWQNTIGGSKEDYIMSASATSDGGYVLCGYTESDNGDVENKASQLLDAWIIKLSAAGKMEWQRTIGYADNEYATAVKQTKEGGYIMAGYTQTKDGYVVNYLVIKLDKNGAEEWRQTYGGSSDDRAQAIEETQDGYYVLGSALSNDREVLGARGGNDIWLIKINRQGELQWQKNYGGSSDDLGYNMKKTKDGGLVICGNTFSHNGDVRSNAGASDFWVLRTDEKGEIVWSKTFGGSNNEYATSVDLTAEGGFIVSGYTSSADGDVKRLKGMYDYWILKLKSDGELTWSKCLGGSDRDYSSLIMQNNDGTYIIIGDSFSADGDLERNHGNEDIWVAKFTPVLVAVQEQEAVAAAEQESLAVQNVQNSADLTGRVYPNPVNDLLTIETSYVDNLTYQLYNTEGAMVWTETSALSKIQVDVSALRSGVYVLMVNTGGARQVHRVVVQH